MKRKILSVFLFSALCGVSAETLYNGIELPKEWPPRNLVFNGKPIQVPYLRNPPAVIPIDVGRQLFVDDFLVETSSLKRVFHQPVKYTGNPILKAETDLEKDGKYVDCVSLVGGGMWWNPERKVFQFWYGAGWMRSLVYAESPDGLHWTRLNQDVKPGTNRILPTDLRYDSGNVVVDWWTKDPSQRYKMFFRPPGGERPGWSLTSADGIHWDKRVATGSCGDRSTFFFNPFRKKWVYSLRAGFHGRARNYYECDDFMDGAVWQKKDVVRWAAVDARDLPDPEIGNKPQLYDLDAVAYESIMLGIFEIHYGPENDACIRAGMPKITDLQFAYSRDGFHWDRPDRTAAIRAERWKSGAWDVGYIQPLGNLCTIHGDRIWFYYMGMSGDPAMCNPDFKNDYSKINWNLCGMHANSAIGVATLRRDGFASMEPGKLADEGELLTRPVTFNGTRLFVNACTPRGTLVAEVRDEKGRPVEPYTFENCVPVSADSTCAPVSWKGEKSLSSLRGRPVRFAFRIQYGGLYSFWISRDATGRSDGYVAGGGPGFTAPTDTVGSAASVPEIKKIK